MKQTYNYVIKQLHTSDIFPGLLDSFAHSQKITKKWVKNREGWVLTDAFVLREWSSEKRIWITEYMSRQIENGGGVFGAFIDEQIVGFCCIAGTVCANYEKYANLTMLFVDDAWKRNGIGKMLFEKARRHAILLGAEKIFISAIPSEETIAFYLKMGCYDAKEIVKEFVDSEDDRYLEIPVGNYRDGKLLSMPCYCGHDCAKCVTYIATQTNDDDLRRKSQNFYKETFSLDIPLNKFNCNGGRSENVFELCKDCPFVKCCKNCGVNSCKKCPEYLCKDISDYKEKYVNKCNQIF